MINTEIQQLLETDFEKYMFSFYNEYKRFGLEDFNNFSTTILNYYINNKVIELNDRKEAAYYLTTLYNKGIGNRIIEEHLQLISQTIASDYNIDFSVIQRLFGN